MVVWVLEALILLAAAVQAARVAARPAFRREFVWRPGQKARWLAAAAGMGTVAVLVALRWPVAWHLGMAGLTLAMALAWWRARPSYGRLRRLPPGSLGLGHSLDALGSKRYYLEQATRLGPVFKMSEYFNPVVCVVGLRRARTILFEHAASIEGAAFWKPLNRFIPRGPLRLMTPESHQELAPVFRAAYRSLALEAAEPEFRASCRRALTRLAADSAQSPRSVWRYVQRAFLEAVGFLLYGLSHDDPRLDALGRWLPMMLMAPDRAAGWRRQTGAAFLGVRELMRGLQANWADGDRAGPSALRCLVAAAPTAIEDATLAHNFILVSGIAYSDLSSLHVWIFKFLSGEPGIVAALRSAPAEQGRPMGTPDLATRVVMETIRLERSVYLYRSVVRAFEFEGMVFPAGWTIRFCVGESHRDPTIFPDPERFDPDRFASRTYGRDEYAPFGLDGHGCMGGHIALFLGRIFVEELATGFDWRVASDGRLERGRWHRHHWHYGAGFRVVVTPRPDSPVAP